MRWLVRLVVVVCLAVAAQPVPAQQTLEPAAVVNDEVITELDLRARLRLVAISSGLKGTPENMRRLAPRILRNLINERLQLQEAERLGISVEDEEMNEGVQRIAQRNNMTREQFLSALERNGIMTSTLTGRVRANLAWQKVIKRQIRPQVNVTQAEVQNVVERRKARSGQRLLRLREIYLTGEDGSDNVRQTADRLIGELRNGAQFGALARQFSQAATAATGGDLGWITPASLPDAVAEAAKDMETGSIAGPIPARNGYYILALEDTRRQTAGETKLTLKQLMIPVPDGADDQAKADIRERVAGLRENISGCGNVEDVADGADKAQVIELGTMKLGDMPETVQQKVGELEADGVSDPFQAGGGIGVVVVCEREETGLDRQAIRRNLIRTRVKRRAQRYLRDLRQRAHIEIRMDLKQER